MSMPQEAGYHPLARCFHWLVAVLVFAVWPLGALISVVGEDVRTGFYFWHESLGFVLLWLMLARLCVRFLTTTPGSQAGLPRALGFQHQAELVEIVEFLAGELRRGGIADQVGLADEALALEPGQRLAHRGLGHVQLARQAIDRDAGPRRDLQRHDAFVNPFMNALGNARRPHERAFLVAIRCYSHAFLPRSAFLTRPILTLIGYRMSNTISYRI